MGTYKHYSDDPVIDGMISRVADRPGADDPFTADDLAREVATTVKNFGAHDFEDHPQDGLIEEDYWAHRISRMYANAPASTLDDLHRFIDSTGIRTRTKRGHRKLFLDCLVHHPQMSAVLTALRADQRFSELDLW